MPKVPIEQRFASKYRVDEATGCWLWTASLDRKGYGQIGSWDSAARKQSMERAHRVSYRLHKGDPGALFVCHSCDTPACVNPDHLFLGTHLDNMADMCGKGRHFVPGLRHEKHGRARLDTAAVDHIRKREMKGTEYARLYGVTSGTIYHVLRGATWTTP